MHPALRRAVRYAVAGTAGLLTGFPLGEFAAAAEALTTYLRVEPLERLASRVLAEVEEALGPDAAGIESLEGTLLALLERHAPDARTVVERYGRDPGRIAAGILREGADLLARVDAGGRGLLGRVLAEIYRRILAEERLPDLANETFRALLDLRGRIDALPREVAMALLALRARLALHEGRLVLERLRTDSALLRSEYAVIPFHPARKAELGELLDWAHSDVDADVRLLHGPGGMGKTRLAMELADRLRERGWEAGFLRREADGLEEEAFRELLRGERPLLVVVDYAETRQDALRLLLAAANRHGRPGVRILLLARAPGDWWDAVRRSTAEAWELTAYARAVGLEPLPDDAGTRLAFHEAARRAFADRLGVDPPETAPPDLSPADFGRPLFLAMAALASVRGVTVESAEGALRWVLDRERRQWDGRLAAEGLEPALHGTLARAAALAVLLGGAEDVAGLEALVASAPTAEGIDGPTRAALARILAELYPERPGVGALRPDILGEELVAAELERDPRLVDAALAERWEEARTVHALTVLARLALRRPERQSWLDAALDRDPVRLLPPALEVAKQFPDVLAAPLARMWQAVPETERPAVARRLWRRLPERTVALRAFALAVTEVLVGRASPFRQSDPDLAAAWNDLSNRLADLGRREDALAAITEAVRIRRRLAARHPDAFEPDLATSLVNLSNHLAALGRREEALAAITEAVAIRRRLAERTPDAFEPDLAMSLHNLSLHLAALGRRGEALAAVTEAAEIRRRLAARHPDAFEPDLATSLNNLSVRLADLDRREEALEAITQAVEIRRRLAARHPDAFEPDLAASLHNLSLRLADLGRRGEALAAVTEAAGIYRRLAAHNPDAFEPDLAGSLISLSNHLAALGRRGEALEVITEVVAIYRRLAAHNPDAFEPDLAMSLHNLSLRLAAFGRREEALAAVTEAAGIYRRLAERNPDAFEPRLAHSLGAHGWVLVDLGRPEEALGILVEALQILRSYFLKLPEAHANVMKDLVETYERACRDLGREPDGELLAEIVPVLERLGLR